MSSQMRPSTPQVSLVVFDLDSTLVDTLRTIAMTRRSLINRASAYTSLPREVIERSVRAAMRNDLHETRLRRLLALTCDGGTGGLKNDSLTALERDFHSDIRQNTMLADGVRDALVGLRSAGTKAVIWTNKRSIFAREQIRNLDVEGLFETVYCRCNSDDETQRPFLEGSLRFVPVPSNRRKPSPETLREIVRGVDVPEENSILVGNNLANDGGATHSTAVRFVHAAFGMPAPEVEAALFELTGDVRLSYSKERHAARMAGTSPLLPTLCISRNLGELFEHFHFAPIGLAE